MEYRETLHKLLHGVPHFSRSGRKALRPGLENIEALLSSLNVDPGRFSVIHVAGTNGKGSYCHAITQVFIENGYSVGTFTSPHLVDLRERILLNGELIPESEVVEFVETAWPVIQEHEASFFEVMTLMAFWYFSKVNPDVVVLETGLGGRLDCTNVVPHPLLCVITSVGLDHTDILGNDLESIAKEKAGIIKAGSPCLSSVKAGVARDVILQTAMERGSPLKQIEQERDPANTTLRLVEATCDFLSESAAIPLSYPQDMNISTDRIPHLKGRFQKLEEGLYFDVAHNPAAVAAMVDRIQDLGVDSPVLIMAASSDKDVEGIASILPQNWGVVCTSCPSERILPAKQLSSRMRQAGAKIIHVEERPDLALEWTRREHPGIIIVFGTFHLYEHMLASRP